MGIVSSDPATHVRKVTMLREMGATAVVLMNISGSDPHAALRMYGEHVLPQLRRP
jgi:coenzyme F420-dependent glucose-6-phosphate dehydrogenase